MQASPEDTSWEKRLRKHIAFWDHPRNYIFKFWRFFAAAKKLHCRFYFSEPNFEYEKIALDKHIVGEFEYVSIPARMVGNSRHLCHFYLRLVVRR